MKPSICSTKSLNQTDCPHFFLSNISVPECLIEVRNKSKLVDTPGELARRLAFERSEDVEQRPSTLRSRHARPRPRRSPQKRPMAVTSKLATRRQPGQVAFAFCLVVVGAGFLCTLRNLVTLNTGFDATDVAVISLSSDLDGSQSAFTPDQMRQLKERIAASPGVKAVAFAWWEIFEGSHRLDRVTLPGKPQSERFVSFYLAYWRCANK
jgi:hypothetical protein